MKRKMLLALGFSLCCLISYAGGLESENNNTTEPESKGISFNESSEQNGRPTTEEPKRWWFFKKTHKEGEIRTKITMDPTGRLDRTEGADRYLCKVCVRREVYTDIGTFPGVSNLMAWLPMINGKEHISKDALVVSGDNNTGKWKYKVGLPDNLKLQFYEPMILSSNKPFRDKIGRRSELQGDEYFNFIINKHNALPESKKRWIDTTGIKVARDVEVKWTKTNDYETEKNLMSESLKSSNYYWDKDTRRKAIFPQERRPSVQLDRSYTSTDILVQSLREYQESSQGKDKSQDNDQMIERVETPWKQMLAQAKEGFQVTEVEKNEQEANRRLRAAIKDRKSEDKACNMVEMMVNYNNRPIKSMEGQVLSTLEEHMRLFPYKRAQELGIYYDEKAGMFDARSLQ